MLKHYNFIPFGTVDIPSGSSLVFAPHPDDETFGLGGSILQMTAKGQVVNVVMVTDGAAGGDEAVRKAELQNAAAALGVNEVHFLGAPDGDLQVTTENIKKAIALIESYNPENIFFPSPFEYHPDHRATAWLVWDALQSIGFLGSVFSYEIANQSPVNTLVDITSLMQKKIEVMKLYASQNEQMDYVDTIAAMNRSRAYTGSSDTVKYVEAFFRFPDISMDLMSYYYTRLNTYHKGVKSEKLPLVSILIRTKDRPERLKLALESLVKQTYQQFEVNIVNDGGVSVQSVVDTFDFERIFVKNHKISKGRAAAANALLRMIQGEYAIFLDDDDTFDADHIENLVRVMRQNENMLAAYSGIRVGNGIDTPLFNKPYNAALLRRGNYIPFHAVLFSSKLLEDGCKFDESLEVYEDWDFWLQVAQKTEFYYHDKVTATYNINGQSGAGGAGGNSTKKINIEVATMKIYEKWLPKWTSSQLFNTYRELEKPHVKQVQNLQKQLTDLRKQLDQAKKSIDKKTTCSSIKIGELEFHSLPIISQTSVENKLKIAVIMHIFYIDLLEEMVSYVENIRSNVTLFVTVHSENDNNYVKDYLQKKGYKNVHIKIVPNRGRDVAPFLIEYSQQIKSFELCCKIHSKKSLFRGGDQKSWRQHLYYNLLGSQEIVNDIIKAFSLNKNLGLLFSDNFDFVPFHCFSWMNNKNVVREAIKKLNLTELTPLLNEEYIDFPASTMFWFRPEAILEMFDNSFTYDDFPVEPIAADGTIAHGLERLFAYVTRNNGYDFIEQNWKLKRYTKNITHKNTHQKLEQFDQVKKNNQYLNQHINQLLKERIREHDDGDPSKRDFELVSTRNYEVQCMELFEEVFKEKMTKEFWNWKYQPNGMKWRGVCAVKDGKVIGHYNGIARNILYFGQHKKAIASGDTMISPKARGGFKQNSPFYTMVKIWGKMNLGWNQEFLLSFGFPNKRVMSLAQKVGLYAEVDTITEILWSVSGINVKSEYSVEKYESNQILDAEILKLWRSMIEDFKDSIIVVRNSDYLKTRYLRHPKFDYEIYLLRDKQKSLKSIFVLKKEKDQMLLMDIIAKKEDFNSSVQEAINVSKNNNANKMKCWITTSKAQLFSHCNAVQKQIDVSIPTSDFTPGFDPMSIKDKWFLMYGDTDFI